MKGAVVWLALVVYWIGGVAASPEPDEGDKYTPKERRALEKFKPLVIPKIPSSSQLYKYRDDDLFFVQWLRFKDLNVKRAERMFLRHLRWRETMRMDTVFEEDWTGIEEDFPVFTDGFTKDGWPIGELWVGDWKVRTSVLNGQLRAAQRYLIANIFEAQRRRLYEGRAAGKNISHSMVLADAEHFNLIEGGCPGCLPLYSALVLAMEYHYPNGLGNIVIVKNPPAWQAVLGVALPLMRPEMRNVVKSVPWRDIWTTYLDSKVDKDQRSVEVDGTLVRDARRNNEVKVVEASSSNNNNNGTASLELLTPEDYESYY